MVRQEPLQVKMRQTRIADRDVDLCPGQIDECESGIYLCGLVEIRHRPYGVAEFPLEIRPPDIKQRIRWLLCNLVRQCLDVIVM